MKKTVVELFAGVGGFRVGLNNIKSFDESGKAIEDGNFKFVWSNQWEPSTKTQHAFDCYNLRFPSNHNSNEDISKVNKSEIPDHTLLVGGFPCQDYSVARSLSKEAGIEGKKGVLWWQINEILEKKRPPFVLLENVDRLLKSPSKQRGRDFAIMLKCLDMLGYGVEWKVINGAEYGHPQRRRRIFIFAFHSSTNYYNTFESILGDSVFLNEGLFAKTFPSIIESKVKHTCFNENNDLLSISNNFSYNFENSGYMFKGEIATCKTLPKKLSFISLGTIVESKELSSELYLDKNEITKFEYLRGGKKILRHGPNNVEYYYSEGSMSPYDSLELPGRTMLTSEGTINRSTHIIKDPKTNQLRLLSPIECERLNQFPDDWTNSGMPEKRRYFMMGNALICGIVRKISIEILNIYKKEN